MSEGCMGYRQRVKPAQPDESHKVGVVRVQDGVVLDDQRCNLRVCHKIARHAKVFH